MKNSIIEKLFENYIENSVNSSDYKLLLDAQVRFSKKLKGMLTEEQNKIFDECQENHMDMEYRLSREYFMAGIKAGITFIIESISN